MAAGRLIEALSFEKSEKLISVLREYKTKLEGQSPLPPDETASRQEVCGILVKRLYQSKDATFINEAFAILRFMSRDINVVAKHMSDATFSKLLILHGNLDPNHSGTKPGAFGEKIELNACSCISNVIFLTKDAQRLCSDGAFIKSIIQHVKDHQTRSHDQNVVSLRLIFLVSALSGQGRAKLVDDYDARKLVLDCLKHVLQPSKETGDIRPSELSKDATNMCSEILKVIFNLNMDLRRASIHSQQTLLDLDATVELCSVILMSKSADPALTESLHCNAGNAVYSVPPGCFNMEKLIKKSNSSTTPSEHLKPVIALINILRNRIMNDNLSIGVIHPLFALLSQLCRLSRDIRIFCKDEILPPRKDLRHRPEEGNQLRNKTIKLFTHNNTDMKHAAADFLFVLCKEKVDRFVKYTGYGNAAGLLALRGLLAGGHGDTVYSDTDSDSDTEEYKEACEMVNPVTGHVPPTRPNPMEGMSDEQKEYLAVQLANELSKLSSDDVIQPMCVGNDGQLITMQQKVHETNLAEHQSDSDS